MKPKELIREIQRLPVSKRMLIIERTIKSIRESELEKNLPADKAGMEKAAETLLEDYRSDMELTAFTSIDFENFYEAR